LKRIKERQSEDYVYRKEIGKGQTHTHTHTQKTNTRRITHQVQKHVTNIELQRAAAKQGFNYKQRRVCLFRM